MKNNNLGISLYLSNIMDIKYLEKASRDGIKNIFVSLHISEELADLNFKSNVNKLFELIKKYGFSNVMCDISPIGIKALGIDIDSIDILKKLGITTLRLDYGFKPSEVIKIAKKINIAINASQVTKDELEFYKKSNILNQIIASHNFYPLIGSGISASQMLEKDSLLRLYGVNEIYSFIPGINNLRKTAEIAYGLPTLEEHRSIDRNLSFAQLTEKFNHSIVYIGDPDYFGIKQYKDKKLDAEFTSKEYLLGLSKFETRESDLFIRLKGTRAHQHSESGHAKKVAFSSIKPTKTKSLLKGDIVVINSNSKRYLGEVLIVKKDVTNIDLSIFNKIGKSQLNDEMIAQIEINKCVEFN